MAFSQCKSGAASQIKTGAKILLTGMCQQETYILGGSLPMRVC